MNVFDRPDSIKLLQELLKDPNLPSSESEDDDYCRPSKRIQHKSGPGGVGPKPVNNVKKSYSSNSKDTEQAPLLANNKQSLKECEDPQTEVDNWLQQQEQEDNLALEDRKRPEYAISYKQAVRTEDLFLQMGNKTSATMSCEDMVIDIQLPDEKVAIEAMGLGVTDYEIDLQTPVYRLKLPLPQKIDPENGQAKFDTDKKILTLTLRMTRELDFVNF